MLESMLPPDVMEAIRVGKEQLPAVIEFVKASMMRIEGKIDAIQVDIAVVKSHLLRMDNTPQTWDEVSSTYALNGAMLDPHPNENQERK